MGSEVTNGGALPPGTLVELFLTAVDRFGDRPAFRFFPGAGPEQRAITYREAYERVRALAQGMRGAGLERGDRAAILAENRPEWAITDYACLCAGVLPVPIYATLTAAQVGYVLENSGAKVVFVSSREQMDKALEAVRDLAASPEVVVFDEVADAPSGVRRWSGLVEKGRGASGSGDDAAFREEARRAAPGDLATILYTSGTTGAPKGVMLTHDNLHSNVTAARRIVDVGPNDSTLSFLPLSHVLQRMVDFLLFGSGCTIAYAHSLDTIADDLGIVKPTIVVAVPRVYERVYAKVMSRTGVAGRLVRWAQGVGMAWAEEKLAGREPSGALKMTHRLADVLVFKKIRQRVGGRLRFFVSGGAPLDASIATFFYGAGILICEGYGLTETSPVTNLNPPERIKIGTVGPAVPGTEIRIAEDGEILVRGPQVMKGYYGLPEETAKVITDGGWFHTGDIGEIDADGYLRITDRKKDLIVTAGGKNIAPQPIENRLKANPFVEQIVMVGDRRKFVALLVVPAMDALEAWAREKGLRFADRAELLNLHEVHALMERELLGSLDDLAGFERPKKLALLEDEFTIENGMLTPTQKVKRRVVQERFQGVIDAFYEDANEARAVFAASEFKMAARA